MEFIILIATLLILFLFAKWLFKTIFQSDIGLACEAQGLDMLLDGLTEEKHQSNLTMVASIRAAKAKNP